MFKPPRHLMMVFLGIGITVCLWIYMPPSFIALVGVLFFLYVIFLGLTSSK